MKQRFIYNHKVTSSNGRFFHSVCFGKERKSLFREHSMSRKIEGNIHFSAQLRTNNHVTQHTATVDLVMLLTLSCAKKCTFPPTYISLPILLCVKGDHYTVITDGFTKGGQLFSLCNASNGSTLTVTEVHLPV